MSVLRDENTLDPIIEALEADDRGFIPLNDTYFGSSIIFSEGKKPDLVPDAKRTRIRNMRMK